MKKEQEDTRASLKVEARLEQGKLLGFKHVKAFNADATALKNEMDLMHKKAGLPEAPAKKS